MPPAATKLDVASAELNVQLLRERKVLKVLYFAKVDIPYSPAEPDGEPYDVREPRKIPLDDVRCCAVSIAILIVSLSVCVGADY